MISLTDYIGGHEASPDWTSDRQAAAEVMLEKVNPLLEEAEANGVELEMNPKTKDLIGGQFHGYGGFRPQDCPQGAPHSSHKEGRAVDVYDPHGDLDRWITDLMLEKHGLYREHPADTPTWCHLSDRAPPSEKRTFHP
jgi:hypothetical protein